MNKFRTYAFWIALSGAVVILVQSFGKLFGFDVDSETIENVIMSICGVLVVLGIITKSGTVENACVDMKDGDESKENQCNNIDDILDNDELYEEDVVDDIEVVDVVDNKELNNDAGYDANCD